MSKRKSVAAAAAVPQPKANAAAAAYEQRANKLFHEGQFGRAVAVLIRAAEQAPDNGMLQAKVGDWSKRVRRFREAITYYEKAFKLLPTSVAVMANLASAYGQVNQLAKGEELCEQALKEDPDDPFVHSVLGILQQKQGKLEDAVGHLRKAMQHLGDKPPANKARPKKRDFNQPETEALLWETLGGLAKAGVHAFAVFGTLLGLVREGSLLPFDKDLDIGIPYSEISRARKCMESLGWVEATEQQPHMINPVAMFHPVRGISVDLMGFVVDPTNHDAYTGFWLDNAPWEACWNVRLPPMQLKKDTSPDGQPLWSLSDPEAWLEATYGDWSQPDPDFDTVIAAKNLCGFSEMVQCYAYSRIHEKYADGNLPRARALARHTLQQRPDDPLIQKVDKLLQAAKA